MYSLALMKLSLALVQHSLCAFLKHRVMVPLLLDDPSTFMKYTYHKSSYIECVYCVWFWFILCVYVSDLLVWGCRYQEIVKIRLPFIISPLTYICNRMLSTGTFPTRLKFSQINPIFKKGNKTEISNYRPISLLTSFSKVFEKVIYKRLYHNVNSNNILAKEQYGFWNNSSTEIASYNLINNIKKALNSNMWVGGIFCDLTKAFDYVNHNILLSKLEFCGITGRANNLIKSYLSDRYQRVLINNKYLKNHFSEWKK